MDNKISFGSTYRVPLVQQGVNKAKRHALKNAVSRYQNVLFPSGENGYVRISVRKRLDDRVEQDIRKSGFKVFQKFDKHNVPKSKFENSNVSRMDLYIGSQLKSKNYLQFGKNKPRIQDVRCFDVNERSRLEIELDKYIQSLSDIGLE